MVAFSPEATETKRDLCPHGGNRNAQAVFDYLRDATAGRYPFCSNVRAGSLPSVEPSASTLSQHRSFGHRAAP